MNTIETDDWAFSACEQDRRNFSQLLNGCLRTLVGKLRMRHSPEEDCYYFSPTRERIERRMSYKSRKKKTGRTVVSRHMSKADKERIAYYRHDGFQHRFLYFGGQWYSIDKFSKWVDTCRSGVERKTTPLITLFPAFPGFGAGKPFCDIVCDAQLTRSINARDIRALVELSDRSEIVNGSVERYLVEGDDLCQNTPCDVVICLVRTL